MADDPKIKKIKKIIKDIAKADDSIITDGMSYNEIVEAIGRLQDENFKFKELKK